VNEHNHTVTETPPSEFSLPLADWLDPSIGEVSTSMGVLVTELIRRSLRTGVQSIGDGLRGMVIEKVDATVADRMPRIEQAARDVADRTARDRAADVADEKVQDLRRRTEEEAQTQARRIQETEERARQATQDLSGRIEETANRVLETTQETARDLSGRIEETEKRVTEATNTLIKGELDQVLEKARATALSLRNSLHSLDRKVTHLEKQLALEKTARQAEQAKEADALGQRLTAVGERVEKEEGERRQEAGLLREQLRRSHQEAQARWQGQVEELRQENQRLAARLAELEKPRGVRALFGKLFARGSKAPDPLPVGTNKVPASSAGDVSARP
jgi:hypothetical protein